MAKGCPGCKFLETWEKVAGRKCFRKWASSKRVNSLTQDDLKKGCEHKADGE